MRVLAGKDFWGNSSLAEWRPRHAQGGGLGPWRQGPGSIIVIFPPGVKKKSAGNFPHGNVSVLEEKPTSHRHPRQQALPSRMPCAGQMEQLRGDLPLSHQ